MVEERDRSAARRAGAVAGIAGLATFLTIHHFWILPIWFVAPVGALIAAVGGVAVGDAYVELGPHLPRRPWSALAVAAGTWIVLLPSFLLAERRGPVFEVAGPRVGELTVPAEQALFAFVVELLVVTTLAAGVVGWLIGRTRRAAVSTALAGLAFALGPGHNIPFLGGTRGLPKELVLIGASVLVAAVLLVELEARLRRGR